MSAFGVLLLAASAWTGFLSVQGNEPKPAKGTKPDAEKVLSAWAAPGAPEGSAARRTVSPPLDGYDDLAQQEYAVEQPFQKVWEFYATKCGEKKQYKPGLTLISGGGDKNARYLLTLRQDAKVPENGWCQFAVHADAFWIVVELHSPDTQKNRTSVTLIAGAR